jgi:small-conductance mechanosensitive channel
MTGRFNEVTTYLVPAAAALGGCALGLLGQRTALAYLQRLAKRTPWKLDDVLVHALRGPIVVWFTLAGLYAALELLRLPATAEHLLSRALLVVSILSVTWAAARFSVRALRESATEGTLPGVSLIANVAAALIWVLGALVVLERLGISITPIVTALGVGGLAVALALQDTLANLFAGLRVLAAGKIRSGDYVRLESGQEGYVQDITWAQTTLREASNSLVIVPNLKLATAITVNYHFPELQQGLTVRVSVARGSDLARVERVALDVARGVQREVEGAVRDYEPVILFQGYGESSVDFLAVLRSSRFDTRGTLIHEYIRRIDARFAAEGIQIPFPTRTVHLSERRESAAPPTS